MTYLDEVLDVFVQDVSSTLKMDLSLILQQESKKWLDTKKQSQNKLEDKSKTKSGDHHPKPKQKESTIEVWDISSNDIDTKFIDINLKKLSVDSLKKLAELSKERYLSDNEKLVIPLKSFNKVKAYWERQAELDNLDAQAILDKLIASTISHASVLVHDTWVEQVIITFLDEEKSKENLQNLADHFFIVDFEINPKENFMMQRIIQHGNESLKQAIIYLVNRCIIEIRQAWKDKSIDFYMRLQNVINDTKREFKEVFEQDFVGKLSKSVLEYLVGLILSFYKNIYQAIQKGGQYFKIFSDEMWMFITGESKSLFQTVINISKAIAGLAILTFTVGLHQYLVSMGLPEVFATVITAFISALVTVAIFRLIEKAAQITGSVFYKRDVARIRREEVERICEELLPVIEEKVAQLDILIDQVDKEREEVFNRSFVQIKASLSFVEIDKIILAYQEIYQYLGKELPFKNEKEFDEFMLSDESFVL